MSKVLVQVFRCLTLHNLATHIFVTYKLIAEAWSTKDEFAKNCESGQEEDEPQLGHHPKAGQ